MRRSLFVLGSIGIFVVGYAAGFYFHGRLFEAAFMPSTLQAQDVSEQGVHYQFINPLLFCQDQNISNFTDAVIEQMENQISQYITDEKNNGDVTDIGVYYKDLNNGPNFSINASLQFAPASLLKIPMAISVYHYAENDPTFLTKRVKYTGSGITNDTQYFAPPESLAPGNAYSVEELVRYMLQDSDNEALSLLGGQLNAQQLASAYSDIGLPVPTQPQPAYTIDVKTYASFFRVLFNASYLNQDDSEHMLSLLSQSAFTKGLVAGVPAGTTVAHKFGEYTVAPGQYQLHDCGIVYFPQEPYLLCVMTKGGNYDTLAAVIAHVSNIVWTVLQNQN